MAEYKRVVHAASGTALVPRARWCNSFGSKLRGFTWRRALQPAEGLVLVQSGESRVNSAIHMLFVFFDLAVFWVNEAGEVVDVALARPWRLHYAPRAPARYVVETHPDVLSQVQVGDRILFD
jgi:uncharacterized membrane protein (UPF0127 family)